MSTTRKSKAKPKSGERRIAERSDPRKRPSQKRSRETVDAILGAVGRVLTKEGFKRLTTQRIAEVAGVSIGSLYQYFPAKEALIGALVQLHLRRRLAIIQARSDRWAKLPLEEAVSELIETVLVDKKTHEQLERAFAESIPKTGTFEKIISIDAEFIGAIRDCMEKLQDQLRPGIDLGLASFVLFQGVRAVSVMAVGYPPPGIQLDNLKAELVHLVLGYLRPLEG